MIGEKITEDERRLAHIWKAVALRGTTGLAFGGAVLAWPSIGLSQLAALIAAFALADGLATVVGAVRLPIAARERAWLAGGGLVGLATGLAVSLSPDLSGRELLFALAGWAVATGVLEFGAGYALPFSNTRAGLLMLGGLISAFFGMTMFAKPGPGALGLLALVAAFAIITGLVRLAFARALRQLVPDEEPRPSGRTLART
jgi:uncharacterized membrane protein HdeD (DUF308 family)